MGDRRICVWSSISIFDRNVFPRAKGHRSAIAKTNLRKCENPESLQNFEYRVHPITLDAVFQTGLIADAASSVENVRAGVRVSIDYVHMEIP